MYRLSNSDTLELAMCKMLFDRWMTRLETRQNRA